MRVLCFLHLLRHPIKDWASMHERLRDGWLHASAQLTSCILDPLPLCKYIFNLLPCALAPTLQAPPAPGNGTLSASFPPTLNPVQAFIQPFSFTFCFKSSLADNNKHPHSVY